MMSQYENLWPTNSFNEAETSNIKDFLKFQCSQFNNTYAGHIVAELVKVKYHQSTATTIASNLLFNNPLVKSSYETCDDNIKDKENINSLFKNSYYAFTLYNEKYKFTLFYISIQLYYPVRIELDDDIAKEINCAKKELSIDSFEELVSIIRNIFNSTKVRHVLQKLKNTQTSNLNKNNETVE